MRSRRAGLRYRRSGRCGVAPTRAGVAEWQTRPTQNRLPERACGFESHHRYVQRRAALSGRPSSTSPRAMSVVERADRRGVRVRQRRDLLGRAQVYVGRRLLVELRRHLEGAT